MEMWAWLGAYLLGFALLQLYLYRYFIRGQSTTGNSAKGTPAHADGSQSATDHSGATDADFIECSQCGSPNEPDPVFTYCAECGGRL